jgi:hypothetical protein
MINVTPQDIEYAQQILLGEGDSFDDERITFITNFETIDLQAVPGSGKTTTLLAKLIAMSRHLPLPSNQGILVLSHTNTAVDEIKERIGDHCPTLFKHPHFIGTIQSFVDKFLCVPAYVKQYERRPSHIDSGMYNSFHERSPIPRRYLSRYTYSLGKLFYGARLAQDNTLIYGDGTPYTKFKTATPTHQKILELKQDIRSSGVLSFDEAYTLGAKYLQDYPQIKRILQKRFMYVFVDEMQDMEELQYQLLDEIFECDECVLQRIGDKNQEIFSLRTKASWTDKEVVLPLSGSHRLTPQTAKCVNQFLTYNRDAYTIDGLRDDGLKPIIFVHTCECDDVLEKVSAHLNKLKEAGSISIDDNSIIKAVAWKKEHEKHTALLNYFPDYNNDTATAYPPRRTIHEYLCECRPQENTYKSRAIVVNQLLAKVLRIEGIKNKKEWYYTSRSFRYHLRQGSSEGYDLYKRTLLSVTRNLLNLEFEEAKTTIQAYLKPFLSAFNHTTCSRALTTFLDSSTTSAPVATHHAPEAAQVTPNVVNYDGFDIGIGTVHSVKGQTHDVTIYLESFMSKYECDKACDQILGKSLTTAQSKKVTTVNTLKMLYVGLSRPKQLACYVIQKDRFDKHLAGEINTTTWEIVDL